MFHLILSLSLSHFCLHIQVIRFFLYFLWSDIFGMDEVVRTRFIMRVRVFFSVYCMFSFALFQPFIRFVPYVICRFLYMLMKVSTLARYTLFWPPSPIPYLYVFILTIVVYYNIVK